MEHTQVLAQLPADWQKAQIVFTCLAAAAAVITFIVKVYQDREAFRRTQVENAGTKIEALYADDKANKALSMLDISGVSYLAPDNQNYVVYFEDIVKGLRCDPENDLKPKEIFMRDCFDAMFTRLAVIVNSIDVRHIRWTDVEPLIGYYVFLIRKSNKGEIKPVLATYCKNYGFPSVAPLIENEAKYPVSKYRMYSPGWFEQIGTAEATAPPQR